jgi:hypothetical protein
MAVRWMETYDTLAATIATRDRYAQSASLDFDTVKSVLHGVAERTNDETLDRYLRRWGMPRERPITLTATVAGYRDVQSDLMKSLVSEAEGITMRNEHIRLRWEYPIEFERVGAGCVCADQPTREQVQEAMPEDLRGDHWSFTVTCSAH